MYSSFYKSIRTVKFLKGNEAASRRLLIHCGLHKTGTTALQTFLRKNTERLRTAGILYPYAGCFDSVASGHHNIAWQIARDRRFDKKWGDIGALAKEIGNFSGDILLSSEDFECSFGRPDAFAPLVQYAVSTQRELFLIIYVRNQMSYLESLYCEMLRHGFGEEYKAMAEQAIDKKMCSMKEWVFHFNYQQLARAVASIPNVRLLFRNFHALKANSVVADFMSIVRVDRAVVGGPVRSNERDAPALSLSLFCQNRLGRPLNSAEVEIVEHLCRDKSLQLVTGGVLRHAMVRTFRRANERFCRKYKVPSGGLLFDNLRNSGMGQSVRLERFFSFETQCAIKEIASLRTRSDLPYDKQTAAMTDAESAVKAWWTTEPAEHFMFPKVSVLPTTRLTTSPDFCG
jgi:hypothetical protein